MEKFHKINTQVKYGRVGEAEKALLALLDAGSDDEKMRALPIYVTLQTRRGQYLAAARMIKEHVRLPFAPQVHTDLMTSLRYCEAEAARIPVEPNYQNQELAQFLGDIPKFLSRSVAQIDPSFLEVTALEDVKWYAHNQNVEAPWCSWNGVRTSVSKDVFSWCYANKIKLDNFQAICGQTINAFCTKIITQKHRGYWYFDDIVADLNIIARSLLVGKIPPLVADMQKAYQSSLFPCGWRGPFPEGQLLVCALW